MFIPFVAIGGGVAMCAWGVHMVWRNDESADQKARDLLERLPAFVRRWIEDVQITSSGVKIQFRRGTPPEIEDGA